MFSRRSAASEDKTSKDGVSLAKTDTKAGTAKGGRKPDAPATGPTDSRPEGGPGKGRPTPKRKEAEQRRREAVKPITGRAARKMSSKERAAERAERLEAIKRGDERYLPARDKGPARGLVRDLVDSRLTAAEFFLPTAVLVLLCSVVGSKEAVAIATNLWALMVVVIGLDLFMLSRRIKKNVRSRYPDEPKRGLGMYGMMRALTWRKMRTPAPRVDRGTKV